MVHLTYVHNNYNNSQGFFTMSPNRAGLHYSQKSESFTCFHFIFILDSGVKLIIFTRGPITLFKVAWTQNDVILYIIYSLIEPKIWLYNDPGSPIPVYATDPLVLEPYSYNISIWFKLKNNIRYIQYYWRTDISIHLIHINT